MFLTGLAVTASVTTGQMPSAEAASDVPSIVFILDASGSMVRETASGETRMDVAKQATIDTVEALSDEAEVGLLVFGTGTGNTDAERAAGCSDVKTLAPLGTLDRAAMADAVDSVAASGFTPIGPALRRAVDMLPDGEPGTIVLISDGVDTCAPPSSCEVASELHRDHPLVTINVVGFGVDEDEAAQQQMTCIGGVGGGTAVSASDPAQLQSRLRAAASSSTVLSERGMNGVALGMSLDEVRSRVDGAKVSDPETVDGVEIVFVECGWGTVELHDDRVVTIRPQSAESGTAEGIVPGDTASHAQAIYGDPVDETTAGGERSVVFQTRPGSPIGYRMTLDGSGRTITRIIVCRCVPVDAVSTRVGDWEITFDSVGPLQLGMTLDEARAVMPTLSVISETSAAANDTSGAQWLWAEFDPAHGLTAVRISAPISNDTELSTAGANLPHARGIRIGETGGTAANTYPGGMYSIIQVLGTPSYQLTDRRGHLLTFWATGDVGGDTVARTRAGSIFGIDLEDASFTRIPFEAEDTVVEEPGAASLPGLPAELDGEWCTRSSSTCVSFADISDQYPSAWVDSSEASERPGATRYAICLLADLDDGCTMAATMLFDYFPVGADWDCEAFAAATGWPGCESDFSSAHDSSQPRLVQVLNHQQGDRYIDTEPMYRAD
ncbi:MAG: VWA domain-containing protein [Microbacterium sp.]|uniref:VWA domain-containing protein n=1 Tax=Microbacterium sp. TaxID=51671 RepID=UPI0026022495|nr:VWA domain-containing protein [Microbacterium sp.]MCX6501579.1 VWA domain-containing protein [Microbacterium sp.]